MTFRATSNNAYLLSGPRIRIQCFEITLDESGQMFFFSRRISAIECLHEPLYGPKQKDARLTTRCIRQNSSYSHAAFNSSKLNRPVQGS